MTDSELDAWVWNAVFGVESVMIGNRAWKKDENDPKGRAWVNAPTCPLFTTDLNAAARAEAKIARMGIPARYWLSLRDVILSALGLKELTVRAKLAMVTATARERCEAMYAMREQIERARAA
ncbi:hypothetical protein LCGC14_0163830 [marine sediment metagenome]|uniref:Uncharacterized protein n=1 Tax=marine sediment metagenome TaxID=412755 RepID=A0A0F9UYE0_9ZZZZ